MYECRKRRMRRSDCLCGEKQYFGNYLAYEAYEGHPLANLPQVGATDRTNNLLSWCRVVYMENSYFVPATSTISPLSSK